MKDTYIRDVLDWRVIDGDTVYVTLDMGCYIDCRKKVRLLGINAPELRKPGGEESKSALENWLAINVTCQLTKTKSGWSKKGKYGRYLGTFFTVDDEGTSININEQMLRSGHASEYEG